VAIFFVIPSYLAWHYSEALKDITRIWTNFLWFIANFFSLTLLLRTFFSPWQRLTEGRAREGFHAEDIAEAIMTNTIMRLVGMLMRSIAIILGITMLLIVFCAGIAFYAVWLLLPVLATTSFVYGLMLLTL